MGVVGDRPVSLQAVSGLRPSGHGLPGAGGGLPKTVTVSGNGAKPIGEGPDRIAGLSQSG